jgi:transposase
MQLRDERYDRAVEFYESGMSISSVAGIFDVSKQTMYEVLKRRGVKFRDQREHMAGLHAQDGRIRTLEGEVAALRKSHEAVLDALERMAVSP